MCEEILPDKQVEPVPSLNYNGETENTILLEVSSQKTTFPVDKISPQFTEVMIKGKIGRSDL